MLVNPSAASSELLTTLPGTNILGETFGIIGASFRDPTNIIREWTVQSLYSPVHGRALGGIRAKVVDQKDFISFVNQRDLEVLLELGYPGAYCKWLDQDYVEPGEPGWFGLCVDSNDLIDDLYDREMEARAQFPEDYVLPEGLNFERRVHDGEDNDYIETMLLLWDFDPVSGMGPDTRLETVGRRWQSIERTSGRERDRLWIRL